jgi:hypothetical protein
MKGPIFASIILLVASALPAQQPKVSDTQFRVEPIGQNLAATIDRVRHSNDRLWLGYDVPAMPGLHFSTCSDWSDSSQTEDGCCGEYRLEDEHATHRSDNHGATQQNVYILLRFDKGDLLKVRTVGAGCRLNAGGVDFAWIAGVKQEESIAYLAGLVSQPSQSSKVLEGVLLAISLHAAPEATHSLEQIASSAASRHTREQAAFWLGVQRGHDGFLALKSLEDKSTEPEFREKLAFDFAQNSDPAAQDELIRMAKFDPEGKVRGQALFWIAQKAGKRATQALNDAIENDPETDVKKRAVFALSQLPRDESVPQLIRVADTNTNLAVRKEAFFWLGQSQDPRALAFLEQVLKK